MPTNPKKTVAAQQALISSRRFRRCDGDHASQPPAAGVRGRVAGQPPPHHQRAQRGRHRQRRQRQPPAPDVGQERGSDPAHEPAEHQRRGVGAHRRTGRAAGEALRHVGHGHHQQPRHQQPLDRAQRQQHGQVGGQPQQRGRHHQQRGRADHHARAADPVGQRPMHPTAHRHPQHHHRDREPGRGRRHVQALLDLGQDRLGGVHVGEHRRRPQKQRRGRPYARQLRQHVRPRAAAPPPPAA